ncbi:hypothetical protein PN456_17240 [Nodularia spumigena CS-586/05]|uniref:hypothetical protein n=1 Tax=Nodularia spumigena TaxID=70799 RepID=UPI00232C6619|nr:hypothetical protein [Nodularia spumigena]MDB9344581.1 hypothetical protein [Nodularia spumigena CS-588/06]MDB9370669.1 hypothetical protein [Nodularia spumigena CS-586/05]
MRTYFGEETAAVLPSQRNKVAETGTLTMMVVGGVLMIVEMSVHQILLGGFMILAAIIIALPKESQALLTNFEKLQRKYGVNLYAIFFAILTVVCFLDFAVTPANAQFFNNAQTWMNDSFGTAAGNPQTTEVIDLFFNVLRGLFLLYVGVALVQIVQAARNDEDWKTLARTPLIIVLSVFVGDLITGLLVGV